MFDSFKPQDICESQCALKNHLILLQTLSDFPWLLRKSITKVVNDGNHVQKYQVVLYQNGTAKKIEID